MYRKRRTPLQERRIREARAARAREFYRLRRETRMEAPRRGPSVWTVALMALAAGALVVALATFV